MIDKTKINNIAKTFQLDNVYSRLDIIKARKASILLSNITTSCSTITKEISLFLDDKLTIISLFDHVVDAFKIDCVKHVFSNQEAYYEMFSLDETENSFLTMFSNVVEHDNGIQDEYYGNYSNTSDTVTEATIILFGTPEFVNSVNSIIAAKVLQYTEQNKRSIIKWRYGTSHGLSSMMFPLKKDWVLLKEAYPFIEGSLSKYYDKFINSSASVLVCYGPPGTGKTSFIRDMMCEQQLNGIITYDPKLLESDEMFTFFLSSPAYDVLIVEDADEILTGDRDDGNKIISKILNASDGLLKLPRKKIILSTNLDELSHIDEAILRPGRCHDVIKFRKLTNDECQLLETKIGVDHLSGSRSLAEIYSGKRSNKKNIGFL